MGFDCVGAMVKAIEWMRKGSIVRTSEAAQRERKEGVWNSSAQAKDPLTDVIHQDNVRAEEACELSVVKLSCLF